MGQRRKQNDGNQQETCGADILVREMSAQTERANDALYSIPASGQECPLHTVASYLDPQQFFKNKSRHHRQDEKHPNPVHPITRDFNVAIRVIDRNKFDGTVVWQGRFGRRKQAFPELSAQANRRYPRQVAADTNRLGRTLSSSVNLHFILPVFRTRQPPNDLARICDVHSRRSQRDLRWQFESNVVQSIVSCQL